MKGRYGHPFSSYLPDSLSCFPIISLDVEVLCASTNSKLILKTSNDSKMKRREVGYMCNIMKKNGSNLTT